MLIVASKRLHQKFGPQTEQMTDIREFEVYPEVGVSGKVGDKLILAEKAHKWQPKYFHSKRAYSL